MQVDGADEKETEHQSVVLTGPKKHKLRNSRQKLILQLDGGDGSSSEDDHDDEEEDFDNIPVAQVLGAGSADADDAEGVVGAH